MNGPILLTGAAGFVGSRVAPELAGSFADRRIVKAVRHGPAPVDGMVADLSDANACERLVRDTQPALVVHLAAHASVAKSRLTPAAVWRDNRDASYHLARALARHAPEATVLLASSAEVYGRSLKAGAASEDTPPLPIGPYGHSKLAAERLFARHLPQSARLIVVRPFNHTGPGQGEEFVVASFAAQLARIEAGLVEPVIRVGNLSARRDFLDVRDVAGAYARLLALAERLPRHSVLNVARGEAVAVSQILHKLVAMSHSKVEVRVDPKRVRPNEIASATARCDRLSSLLPWPPRRSLDETLATVLADQRRRYAI